MIFPKGKMRIIDIHDGRKAEKGWLELNTAAVEMEGVSKIYINLDEVDAITQSRSASSEAAKKARELLGG